MTIRQENLERANEKMDCIIDLMSVMMYGVDAIYGENDKTPYNCLKQVKEELIRFRETYLSEGKQD